MIKTLITTSILAFSQVNFSHTQLQPQRQESNSQSVVQEGIVNYALTLTQKETGTIQPYTTNYSSTYKRTYEEQNDYLYIRGEQLFYSYYKQDGENETQNPLYATNAKGAALPYIKVGNWSGTPQPNYYYYSQFLIMLQITPYNNNINTNIQDTLNLNINTTASEYNLLAVPPNFNTHTITNANLRYDIFTTTANLSNYMGTTTYGADGYINNIYDTLSNTQTFGTTYHRQYNENWTTNPQIKTIDFTIVPEQTNYLFLFITPIITLDTSINYPIAHIKETRPELKRNDIIINGTGIINTTSIEVVDIPGLMFSVLGMPWYFISTAFNLTLFTGTPYQINISNLFLAFISVLVFVFILRLLTKQR